MTRQDKDLDEFGKRSLAALRPTPPVNPQTIADEKTRFMKKAEDLRHNILSIRGRPASGTVEPKLGNIKGRLPLKLFKSLVVIILVLVLLVGSSFTVYAAQSSLPGDPLYTLKSMSEDIRMSMTFSTSAKLELTLTYTNRRVSEIQSLVNDGKPLPDQSSERYQYELENALELAASMDDQQMLHALNEIRSQAERQGMTVDELIAKLPPQASAAILRLQARLQEQVQLSTIGEKNPQAFRMEIKQRAQNRHGPKGVSTSDEPEFLPILGTTTPMFDDDQNNKGGEKNPATEMPGHGNQGNGPWQTNPGNGNHGPNPTGTPQP